ncbi:lysine-rich arabinogalactan protein 19-like [Penaeus monodon]|uniref:lysine-rich arabinogalactan protein 19-like n=1 Tax=Penaeus monodon TaxID=6687 RepID=UPI0018A7BA16|nr:lysine-rich arabinogalactan protein 19-like [Penaeus monodon]
MQHLYMIRLGLISTLYVVCSAEEVNDIPNTTLSPEEEKDATQTYIWTFVAIGLLISCCVFSALLYRKFFGPCDMGGTGGAAAAAATASNATSQTNPVQQVCAIPGMQPTVTGDATSSSNTKPSPRSTSKEKNSPKRTPTPTRSPWPAPMPSAPPIFIHPVAPPSPYGMAPTFSRSTPVLAPHVPSCPHSPAQAPFVPVQNEGYPGQAPPAWGAPAGLGSHYPYSQQPHSF